MSAAGVSPLLIGGEYDMVSRASANFAALKTAHETPITRKDAASLLRALALEHLGPVVGADLVIRWGATRGRGGWHTVTTMVPVLKFDGTPVHTLRWDRGTGSYVAGRARKRRQYTRGADGRYVSVPYIALPSHPMAPGGLWHDARGRSLLRVGLVLHEFAHVLTVRQCRHNPHGPVFTACLDRLVAAWGTARAAATLAA